MQETDTKPGKCHQPPPPIPLALLDFAILTLNNSPLPQTKTITGQHYEGWEIYEYIPINSHKQSIYFLLWMASPNLFVARVSPSTSDPNNNTQIPPFIVVRASTIITLTATFPIFVACHHAKVHHTHHLEHVGGGGTVIGGAIH